MPKLTFSVKRVQNCEEKKRKISVNSNCFPFYTLRKKPPLNPFPNKPWFSRVCSTSLSKTLMEKEKLLVMSNISLFHSVFYFFGELSTIFIKFEIIVCILFQFGSLKFVVWEKIKGVKMGGGEKPTFQFNQ